MYLFALYSADAKALGCHSFHVCGCSRPSCSGPRLKFGGGLEQTENRNPIEVRQSGIAIMDDMTKETGYDDGRL